MYYVGVDIAKITHVASVLSSDSNVVVEPFSFKNDSQGFAKFLDKLQHFNKEELLLGLESTSHYAENLTAYLFERGYRIGMINPYQTANLRKIEGKTAKTDNVDSYLICRALQFGYFNEYTKRDNDSFSLKYLCRFRQKLMKSKSRLKTQLITYIDLIFPEFQHIFENVHLKSTYAVLKIYQTPERISKLRLDTLTRFLAKHSYSHFGREEAILLKETAARSVGVKNSVVPLQIVDTIAQIELLESQLKAINKAIKETLSGIDSPITTIPGISTTSAATILGEIGDVSRFRHWTNLLSYAGLAPKVRQSGKYQAASARMSKTGSHILRYALTNSAWNLVRNNDVFRKFYDSKRANGLRHYGAIGHCSGKLVRVIHKLLSDNIAFDVTRAI